MATSRATSERRAEGEIARVVVSRRRLARRVRELARQIGSKGGRDELTILAVLTGSLVFLADLIRRLPMRTRIEVVSIRSYPGRSTRARKARFRLPLPDGLAGRDVLIVDDILDSGQTLRALVAAVRAAGAARVRTCVLLRKRRDDLPARRDADFAGFDVGGEFVVGYGLDHDDYYRNLPDICVLRDHDRALCAARPKRTRRRP